MHWYNKKYRNMILQIVVLGVPSQFHGCWWCCLYFGMFLVQQTVILGVKFNINTCHTCQKQPGWASNRLPKYPCAKITAQFATGRSCSTRRCCSSVSCDSAGIGRASGNTSARLRSTSRLRRSIIGPGAASRWFFWDDFSNPPQPAGC
jgi:hypothetical protein